MGKAEDIAYSEGWKACLKIVKVECGVIDRAGEAGKIKDIVAVTTLLDALAKGLEGDARFDPFPLPYEGALRPVHLSPQEIGFIEGRLASLPVLEQRHLHNTQASMWLVRLIERLHIAGREP